MLSLTLALLIKVLTQHWLLSAVPVVEDQSAGPPAGTQASPSDPDTAFWLLSNNLLLFIEDHFLHFCEIDSKTHSTPIMGLQ